MPYCINIKCLQRENSDHNEKCTGCGTPLIIQERYWLLRPLKELSPNTPVEVFEVSDDRRSGNRKVMKILRNLALQDAFEQEAQALIWLSHSGIPQVESNDSFETPYRPSVGRLRCLVMEKIEGVTLETWLSQPKHKLHTKLALDWLEQLTEVLSVVHQSQLLHGDINPTNIILRPAERLTLIDFGSVQRLSSNVVGGYMPGYTPPEQVNGKPEIPQSDFFALGRTFVHLLTGQPPLELEAAMETDPSSWWEHSPEIEPALARLIDRLMAPSPGDRPRNTTVLIRDIANLKLSLQATETPPRRLYWWGLLTGTVASIAVGLATWIGLQTRSQPQSACSAPITDVSSLAFSPNGQWLAIASPDQTLRLSKASEGTYYYACQVLPSPVYASQFSPNGKYLIAASHEGVYQIPVRDNGTLGQPKKLSHDGPVVSIAFSPDGQYLAMGSATGSINLLQLATSRWVRNFQGDNYILGLSFSRTGKYLAMVTLEGQATIWNWQKRQEVFSKSQVAIAAFRPNLENHLALSRLDGTTQLWDIQNQAVEYTDPERHQKTILDLRFSVDGRYIVTISTDGETKVWNWKQDTQRHSFKTLNDVVAAALGSSNNPKHTPQLIVAYGNGDIKSWQLTGGNVSHLSAANSNDLAIAEIAFNPMDATRLTIVYTNGTHKQITVKE
jgi:WD40 repeat protein